MTNVMIKLQDINQIKALVQAALPRHCIRQVFN